MIKPFEINTVPTLWNDPYISKEMLKNHLDPNTDIASRKEETIKKTVSFLINQYHLDNSSSICDFGCGPGLYTNLFEQHKLNVTGIDFSHNSIDYARKQNTNVNYIEANYLSVDTKETYDLITLIYYDFCVLSPNDTSTLLYNIKKHLKDDGIFFFDVLNMNHFNQAIETSETYRENNGLCMEGKCLIYHKTFKYEKEKVLLYHIIASGSSKIELYNWLKCYTLKELSDLLNAHGFEVLETFDDTFGNLNKKSTTLAIACKKQNNKKGIIK